jgi:hypothetical protein
VSSRFKKGLNAEAAQRGKLKWDQAVRDAGGIPYDELAAELKQIRHERLVYNDEELCAFCSGEVEFFRSRFGHHFRDGITEFPREPETRGFPVTIRVEAYHSCWQIWDMEPADDLVVEYHFEYPDGFAPKVIDTSAHEAALCSYDGAMRRTGYDDVENLALNLVCYCLTKNLIGFGTIVRNEMQRRRPEAATTRIRPCTFIITLPMKRAH